MAVLCVAAEHGRLIKKKELENVAIVSALQLEAARDTPALSRL